MAVYVPLFGCVLGMMFKVHHAFEPIVYGLYLPRWQLLKLLSSVCGMRVWALVLLIFGHVGGSY